MNHPNDTGFGPIQVEHIRAWGVIVALFRIEGKVEVNIIDRDDTYVVEVLEDEESGRRCLREWCLIVERGLTRVFDLRDRRYHDLARLRYEEPLERGVASR